jgi:murein DD-endopeptidase MepM/ murein hydrolase activator NlpD
VCLLSCWAAAAVACTARPAPTQRAVATGGIDVELRPDSRVVNARVLAGQTFASLLRGLRVADDDVVLAIRRASAVFDLRKVRAAQPIRLETTADGALRAFDYEIDRERVLRVRRDAADLTAEVATIPKTHQLVTLEGTIDFAQPSLVAAMDAAGGSIDLSIALADVFSGEIDFNTELQPADRFAVVVEKQYRAADGTFAGYGPILAARFENRGRRFEAVRFAPDGGDPGYYDERGVSVRRFFLRSPLEFDPVITSGFARSRLHPILQEYRAHLGVDYRAPQGAPVVAVADGVVVEAGTSGGAGRMVHLRHAGGYETEYLHLSAIAVRVGDRVRQGNLIGRVGSTGLATGPHLDYRVKRDGAFVNPVTAIRGMRPPEPIAPSAMPAFADARDTALAALDHPPAAAAPAPPLPH